MKIVNKEILTETKNTRIVKLDIYATALAPKARPGQFVVVMATETGERIPLTIVDKNEKAQTVTLIFQEVGLTTKLLGRLNIGDSLFALLGPLGHPTQIKNYGKVILVGGGVGIAEIYPIAKALKEAGNEIFTILGSRTKELLILEKELKDVSDKLFIATDDGSYGKKGFTTDILKELLFSSKSDNCGLSIVDCGLIYAVGPIPMMKKVALITRQFNIKTFVSLNALMVDATGMCGCCRVTVDNKIKFSCVDGPEFDAHSVDWDELEKRNKIYLEKEKHICKFYKL